MQIHLCASEKLQNPSHISCRAENGHLFVTILLLMKYCVCSGFDAALPFGRSGFPWEQPFYSWLFSYGTTTFDITHTDDLSQLLPGLFTSPLYLRVKCAMSDHKLGDARFGIVVLHLLHRWHRAPSTDQGTHPAEDLISETTSRDILIPLQSGK